MVGGRITRREFVRAAVAVGGSAGLSACLDFEDSPTVPRGDPAARPERQHAWNGALERDRHGNHRQPHHHVLVGLDYEGPDPPTTAVRERVERAFRTVERAYERSNGGLLFTVGYSPAYFEGLSGRPPVSAALPEGVDLPAPRALSGFEDPAFDDPDAVVHLASDHGSVALAAERALLGERGSLNGVEVTADLSGAFARRWRRTGFVGAGLPAKNQDVDGIPDSEPVPEEAPLYMGFESGFRKNQASEDRVTVESGPFAGGTTQHLSRLRLRLEDWYDEQSREDRVAEMFCPHHAREGVVEGVGDNLGDDSGIDGACTGRIDDDARKYGRVGHSQKSARARDEDGSPVILRRDFDSTDGGAARVHFLSLQRSIADFERTKEAMNGADLTDHPGVKTRVDNGILEYVFVERRGNYLLPPRSRRALPVPGGR